MEIIDLKSGKKAKANKQTGNIDIKFLDKAVTLSEALPYIQKFSGEIFVVKFGGSAMGDPKIVKEFAKDVVLLKKIGINPVVVHGGGPQIGKMLERLKIKSEFIDGLRVTDRQTVDIVEMVLCGSINKELVQAINNQGGQAIGLSGKDANLIEARKLKKTKRDTDSNIEKILDLGFVGEPVNINPDPIIALDENDFIPVIAPIGVSKSGETFNINADLVAGKLAESLQACKLIMLSDVNGIFDEDKKQISHLTIKEADKLIKKKVIEGGMIPKTRTCIKAIENSVETAHILNGKIPHILLVEVFTANGAGTMLSYDEI